MIHINSQRRTSIDKFNNRPPFDVKKMDDATCTENRKRGETFSNKFEKRYVTSAAKSYINVVKYLEHFGEKFLTTTSNKTTKVIPKIMENFQKATPKTASRKLKYKKKSESLETLFRSKSPNFGKNLPDHKLMKDLMKDFHGEKAWKKPMSGQYQQIDMIPSKDLNVNRHKGTAVKKSGIRVDKQTSTSGLQWPIVSNEMEYEHVHVKPSISREKKSKSKIPLRRGNKNGSFTSNSSKIISHERLRNTIHRKISSGSSGLEYFPTKEKPLSKSNIIPKVPSRSNKLDREFSNYKHNVKPNTLRRDTMYLHSEDKRGNRTQTSRRKENSFVQLQVEKFNKKTEQKNIINRRHAVNNNNKKMARHQDDKKHINKRYISLMTSMRDSLPKLEERVTSESVSEIFDWSDNQTGDEVPVRFPKETRAAMENLLQKHVKRVPLTKYVKNENCHIHPAISSHGYEDDKINNMAHPVTCHKRVSHLPCAKNLLCQRGSHVGPCKRPETVPPRYNKLKTGAKVFK